MVIQTVGSMEKILGKYSADDWTKNAEVDFQSKAEFKTPIELTDAYAGEKVPQSFSELIANSLADVNSLQKDANNAMERLVTGKSNNLHETLLLVEEASIAFKTMNQIRNKVIEAYKEIMRMQI